VPPNSAGKRLAAISISLQLDTHQANRTSVLLIATHVAKVCFVNKEWDILIDFTTNKKQTKG